MKLGEITVFYAVPASETSKNDSESDVKTPSSYEFPFIFMSFNKLHHVFFRTLIRKENIRICFSFNIFRNFTHFIACYKSQV